MICENCKAAGDITTMVRQEPDRPDIVKALTAKARKLHRKCKGCTCQHVPAVVKP